MKVRELIDLLRDQDPDDEVVISADNHENWLEVSDIDDDGGTIVLSTEEIA